ncbi:phage Gp37/Gp68 family protein [Micromonospora lupini]|uniref:DUF5131 family protein n=1 Tax=Micromonospora lupini TaxID=285679 RepID=UPI002256DC80|nr:phage Gp37/Gp68 family protein [Micromonospora lupini]MCX5070925.1 phage Gp37/Gp68 family protein [Micromonospora lupini]
MATRSKIEWTTSTWNPTLGCERVSPGCTNCYAIREAWMHAHHPTAKIAQAFAGLVERRDDRLDWTGTVRTLPERLGIPLHWRTPRRVFVDSQSDLFHDDVPDGFIAAVFAIMAAAPQHTYQLLTKRHGRLRSLLGNPKFRELMAKELRLLTEGMSLKIPGDVSWAWPLPNVWIGVSVEDQKSADLRIPALLATPAAVRWLSCEPLLGQVDLSEHLTRRRPVTDPYLDAPDGAVVDGMERVGDSWQRRAGIDWVVAGGESGSAARPMHPDWARLLRDQCADAGVPFFFKQWGAWAPFATHFAADHGERLPWDTYVNLDGSTGEYAISEDHDQATNWTGDPKPGNHAVTRVGKKRAGRLLDGVEHLDMPALSEGGHSE